MVPIPCRLAVLLLDKEEHEDAGAGSARTFRLLGLRVSAFETHEKQQPTLEAFMAGDGIGPSFEPCPICGMQPRVASEREFARHIDSCLDRQAIGALLAVDSERVAELRAPSPRKRLCNDDDDDDDVIICMPSPKRPSAPETPKKMDHGPLDRFLRPT
jgi:hypothetical protein